MESRRRVQYWLSLILPLILASVLMVACDAGQQEGGGGGLEDQTPLVPGDETPMIEPTLPVEEPTVEVAATVEVTPTMELTPTVEVTPTMEVTPTEEAEADETPQVDVEDQDMVALASDLIGRNIQDETGMNVGVIDELLADDTGAVRYVIVDAVALDETTTGDVDTAETTPEATPGDTTPEAEGTAEDDTGLVDGNTLALTWDALEVRQGTLTDGEVDTETDPSEFHLVYVDTTPLAEQMTFDPTILDEQGAILDDQAVEDTEVDIPSEFANLLQVSEYNNVNLTNPQGEDLGEIEDALIDLQEGRIVYVVIDVGGFLGIGERSIAVPFEEFQIDVTVADDAEEESVTLDADQERLENAPEIDLTDWVPNVDVDWDVDWRDFWGADVDVNTEDTNG